MFREMFKSLGTITAFIVITVFDFSREDWVEIPQTSEQKHSRINGDYSVLAFGNASDSGRVKSIEFGDISRPNQAWLDYQVERFGMNVWSTDQSMVVKNINKFVVTDRVDSVNKSFSDTYQFAIPLKVYDSTHGDHEGHSGDRYIQIDIKTPTTRAPFHPKPTRLLNNRNKFQVTIFNDQSDDGISIEEPDDEEEHVFRKVSTTPATTALTEDTRLTSFQRFLEYLKAMQNSFVKTTSMTIHEKIDYLNKFKDRLLAQIEERIQGLWRGDGYDQQQSDRRSRRSLIPEDAFMSFPTAEGALVTINFLTFAVFLIKLVLQVIKTVKSKHVAYNGFSVSTMEGYKVGKHRNVRSYPSQSDERNPELDLRAEEITKIIHSFRNKMKLMEYRSDK